MSELYHTTDLDGITELKPDKQRLREILTTLDQGNADSASHPDVSLINDENGWSLSVFASGVVAFEQLDQEEDAPFYMKDVSRDTALGLWLNLAAGKIETLLALPWLKDPSS
ncbi:MAG: Uncharacterised protein [Opitutia bacterium UBA7350]|nr:MAG: Uncharacterised protein [Opitutae bacterium UBA7350]